MKRADLIALMGLWDDVAEWSKKTLDENLDAFDCADMAADATDSADDANEVAIAMFFGLVQVVERGSVPLHQSIATHLEGLKNAN